MQLHVDFQAIENNRQIWNTASILCSHRKIPDNKPHSDSTVPEQHKKQSTLNGHVGQTSLTSSNVTFTLHRPCFHKLFQKSTTATSYLPPEMWHSRRRWQLFSILIRKVLKQKKLRCMSVEMKGLHSKDRGHQAEIEQRQISLTSQVSTATVSWQLSDGC